MDAASSLSMRRPCRSETRVDRISDTMSSSVWASDSTTSGATITTATDLTDELGDHVDQLAKRGAATSLAIDRLSDNAADAPGGIHLRSAHVGAADVDAHRPAHTARHAGEHTVSE